MPKAAEVEPEPTPGCQHGDGCPFTPGGTWRRHVDKDGTRSTRTEPDGSYWNRSCPVNGCPIKAYV